MDKNCENCRFCYVEKKYGEFVCGNPDSEYVADYVYGDNFCEDFEEKE